VSLERLRTLATLPESERIALVRTIVDGAPAAEVAKDMGISPHRVYALVNTGSARVRKRAA
jgi:DNA-directed RNA polymerase specialized sigma24 family protein